MFSVRKTLLRILPGLTKSQALKATTAPELRSILEAVLTKQGPYAFVAQLHRRELQSAPTYEWPWMQWKHLCEQDPSYRACLATLDLDAVQQDNTLAKTILSAAITLRLNKPQTDSFKQILESYVEYEADITALPNQFKLELAFIAFSERKWPLLRFLTLQLVTANHIYDQKMTECIHFLAFDMFVFATYRPAMPTFVATPKKLVMALEAIESKPEFSHILTRENRTALIFKANMLAIKGKFERALQLYAQANNMEGFRSPVFAQSQVLLPVSEADNPTLQSSLKKWHKKFSDASFSYPHKTANEHAILVTADEKYFNLYAELYIRIVGVTNPGILIHFHLVNPSENIDSLTEKFQSWEENYKVRINWTLENNKIAKEISRLVSGVCVCTRYIYLPDYLNAYASVTITDIDGWLLASSEKLTNFAGNDSLVSSKVWRRHKGYWRLPWGNLSGGYASIKSTDNSKRFSKLISAYLIQVYKNNAYNSKPLFYADQAAHFLCLQYAHKHFHMEVGFIGGGFAQSEEQRFHIRYKGKQDAMAAKLREIEAIAANVSSS